MPTSVLNIDVNDEKFRRFQKEFDKYVDATKKMPKDWAKTEDVMASAFLISSTIEKALSGVGKDTKIIGRNIHTWNTDLHPVERTMRRIGASAKGVKDSLSSVVSSVWKWSALGAGLLGVGGLFGLERLASSSYSDRRVSAAVGVPTGSRKAFETVYGNYIGDPGDLLSKSNRAKYDPDKQQVLRNLGIDPSLPADEIAEKLINRSGVEFRRSRGQTDIYSSTGIDQFLDITSAGGVAERQRLNPGELEAAGRTYRAAAGAGAIGAGAEGGWAHLMTTLGTTVNQLDATLKNSLAPLAKPLEELSKAAIKAFSEFLGGGAAETGIRGLTTAITWLGNFLKTEDFKKDFEDFSAYLGMAVGKFRLIFGATATTSESGTPRSVATSSNAFVRAWNAATGTPGPDAPFEIMDKLVAGGMSPKEAAAWTANIMRESGGNPYLNENAPEGGKNYGLASWHDPDRIKGFETRYGYSFENVDKSGRNRQQFIYDQLDYIKYEKQKNYGNIRDRISEANLTEADMAARISKYYEVPRDPEGSVAALRGQDATKLLGEYLTRIQSAQTTVRIDNQTGGNLTTTAGALR